MPTIERTFRETENHEGPALVQRWMRLVGRSMEGLTRAEIWNPRSQYNRPPRPVQASEIAPLPSWWVDGEDTWIDRMFVVLDEGAVTTHVVLIEPDEEGDRGIQ